MYYVRVKYKCNGIDFVTIIFNNCFPLIRVLLKKRIKDNIHTTLEIISMKRQLDAPVVISNFNTNVKIQYPSMKKQYDTLLCANKKDHYDNGIRSSDNRSKYLIMIL